MKSWDRKKWILRHTHNTHDTHNTSRHKLMVVYSNVAKDKCFAYNVTHIEEGDIVWWIVGKNKYLTYSIKYTERIAIREVKDYCIPYHKRNFIHFKERNLPKYKRPFIRIAIFKQEGMGPMTISQNRKNRIILKTYWVVSSWEDENRKEKEKY